MLRYLRILLACCAAFGSAVGASVHAQSRVASQLPENAMPGLRQLLDQVVEKSSAMEGRRIAETERDGARLVSRSVMLPDVMASVDFRREETLNLSGAPANNRAFYTFRVEQPLFHWGALSAIKENGELAYDIEKLITNNVYRTELVNLRIQFLNLVIARQDLALSEESYQIQLTDAGSERQRFKEGLVTSAALDSMEIQLNQAELGQIEKRGVYNDTLNALARSSGFSIGQLAAASQGEVPVIKPLSGAEIDELAGEYSRAIEAHPYLQRLERESQQARNDLKVATRRLWPKVNLATGLTQYDLDDRGTRREEEIAYAGLTANWNIFDGFEADGHKRIAQSKLRSAEFKADEYTSLLRYDLARYSRQLKVKAESLAISERILERSEANLKKIKEEFALNKVSARDVSASERSFTAQVIAAQRSRADYLGSLSGLVSLLALDPYANQYAGQTID